jgi:hypothetical protein
MANGPDNATKRCDRKKVALSLVSVLRTIERDESSGMHAILARRSRALFMHLAARRFALSSYHWVCEKRLRFTREGFMAVAKDAGVVLSCGWAGEAKRFS